MAGARALNGDTWRPSDLVVVEPSSGGEPLMDPTRVAGPTNGLSAIDNIHEIAGWVPEKEPTKPPVFRCRPIHHFCPRGTNGSLGGIKIVYAD